MSQKPAQRTIGRRLGMVLSLLIGGSCAAPPSVAPPAPQQDLTGLWRREVACAGRREPLTIRIWRSEQTYVGRIAEAGGCFPSGWTGRKLWEGSYAGGQISGVRYLHTGAGGGAANVRTEEFAIEVINQRTLRDVDGEIVQKIGE
jgi:hypothetical protein